MTPFTGMEKTVKQYVVYKEEMSVHKRFKRVQGCATLQLHEALHIVTGQVFAVPTKSFQDYHGSTAGSMIGPVVMPSPEQIWSLPWKLKKVVRHRQLGPSRRVNREGNRRLQRRASDQRPSGARLPPLVPGLLLPRDSPGFPHRQRHRSDAGGGGLGVCRAPAQHQVLGPDLQ